MLNFLPNVRLSGENNNELYIASLLASTLRRKKQMDYDREYYGAWTHHKIPTQTMACPIQQVVSAITPPPSEVLHAVNETGAPSLEGYDQTRIFGLKTIRIAEGNWSPSEAAAFFKESFPCSRIVVNIRSDTESQAASRSNVGFGDGNVTKREESTVVEENKFFTEFARNLGLDTARLMDMTMWTQDVSLLNDLLGWLGYKECHFKSIVHENHDGYGRDHSDPQIGDQCHYPH